MANKNYSFDVNGKHFGVYALNWEEFGVNHTEYTIVGDGKEFTIIDCEPSVQLMRAISMPYAVLLNDGGNQYPNIQAVGFATKTAAEDWLNSQFADGYAINTAAYLQNGRYI